MGSNGQISVVVSGGTEGAGYSYQWIKNPLGAALAIGTQIVSRPYRR